MSMKFKDIFTKIEKDPYGKSYSAAERNAVASRWFKTNGSKTPSVEEAEEFMKTIMKRSAPKTPTRKSTRTSKRSSARKATASKTSTPQKKAIGTKKTTTQKKTDDNVVDFLYADDPMETYQPSSSSAPKGGDFEKDATPLAVEEEKGLSAKNVVDFKTQCEEYIRSTQKESSPGTQKTLFVFVPSEKQLNEDGFASLGGEGHAEYLMAHIALPLPRAKKGMQDLTTLNERQWSIRRQGSKMVVKSSQPFWGSCDLKEKSEEAKKVPGFANVYVKYCYLGDNEGSLLS